MVRASIVGALLANLLLQNVIGIAALAAGVGLGKMAAGST